MICYKGKKVLVTGHTGFKGAWLAFWLNLLGAKVTGIALPNEGDPNLFKALKLDKAMHHTTGDIRDLSAIQPIFDRVNPEIVFHLAAQPIVRHAYRHPKPTFDTNVGGSVNILELVRNSENVKVLIYVTSDKCYRNQEGDRRYREGDELGGEDPYSASKAAAEMAFEAYQKSFFRDRTQMGAASVRAGNVIGGGDWAQDRIVPDTVRALLQKKPVVIRNPHFIRPWQHVLDPLYGYLLLGEKLLESPAQFSGSWNFGPNDKSHKTVQALVEAFISAWGEGAIEIAQEARDWPEAKVLRLNVDKAVSQLGWTPRVDFETAARITADWYQAHHKGNDVCQLTKKQIVEYMESLR